MGLAVLWTSSSAGAESAASGAELLSRARAAHHDLEYNKARELLHMSLVAGGHDRTSLAELYGLAGQIAAAFGRPDEAYEHYRRMVVLGDDTSLPEGLAPKIIEPFQRARLDLVHSRGIQIRVARSTRTTLTIAVSSDPLKMVAGFEVVFGHGDGEHLARADVDGDVALVVIPAGAGARVRVHAVDRFGNRLAELEWQRSSSGDTGRRVRAGDRNRGAAAVSFEASGRGERPLYGRWQLWGGAAAAAGAVAVYYGLRAQDEWLQLQDVIGDSGSHSFDDARRLEDSSRRNQLYSNIATATALGLAGVSLYLGVRGDGGTRPGMRASVGPHGAAVSWSGRF